MTLRLVPHTCEVCLKGIEGRASWLLEVVELAEGDPRGTTRVVERVPGRLAYVHDHCLPEHPFYLPPPRPRLRLVSPP